MGTNYYLFTQEREKKSLLGEKYEVVDEPDFGYMLHIMKNSCGWLCLFEGHSNIIQSVEDIKKLYDCGGFQIIDEYGEIFTWDEFEKIYTTKYEAYKKGERYMLKSHLDVKQPYDATWIYADYAMDKDGYEFTMCTFR